MTVAQLLFLVSNFSSHVKLQTVIFSFTAFQFLFILVLRSIEEGISAFFPPDSGRPATWIYVSEFSSGVASRAGISVLLCSFLCLLLGQSTETEYALVVVSIHA